MVLLCSALSVVLDVFPKAPATPGTCWWQKTNLVHSGSHGHNWEPAQAVWLVGTIVFLLWNMFFWLYASVSKHLMAWTVNTMVMGFWLPFPSLLKTELKAAACLGLAGSPRTGSWTTPAYSLLLLGATLASWTGKQSWILTACFLI